MLVIKVELWSAITGKKTEIARMSIANDSTSATPNKGNYTAQTYRGRTQDALVAAMQAQAITRQGAVVDYPRKRLHVWNLVAQALQNMGYGK